MTQKLSIELDDTFPLPKVCIRLEAFQKIFAFARACPVEVNGFGIVQHCTGNVFVITDSFILPQKATAVSVETNEDALHKFLYDAICAGLNPNIKLQWHSHVDMDVYCSGKDIATIADYQNDFMISLVVNKLGKYHCRLDIFKPVRIGFNATLNVIAPISQEIMAYCQEEVNKKVEITRHSIFGSSVFSKLLDQISPPKTRTHEETPITVPAENIGGPDGL